MGKRINWRTIPTKVESRVNLHLKKGSGLIFLIPLLLFLMVSSNSAQAAMQVQIEWEKTYGSAENDYTTAVIQTADGGFVLAGTREVAGKGEIWLFKTNSKGVIQWEQTYGGPGYESCKAAIQTEDGGFALACTTDSYGAGNTDIWLVKANANGQGQWSQTYGGAENDYAADLIQLNDGGFLLVGETSSFGEGSSDGWVVRTDAGGSPLWTQTYGFESAETFNTVIKTSDGGFALGGEIDSVGADKKPAYKPIGWFVKINTNGMVQWARTYGGLLSDRIKEIIEMPDGSFFLIGSTTSFGYGLIDGWLIKTKSDGFSQWQLTFGGEKNDAFYAGIQTTDGGLALAGEMERDVHSGKFWLLKVKPDGTIEWSQSYSNEGRDKGYDVIQTKDGGYALTGSTTNGGSNAWLVKTVPEVTTSATITGIIFQPKITKSIIMPPITTTTTPILIISQPTAKPVIITATDDPLQTMETTSATTTSESTLITTSETSQEPATVTITKEPLITIPGFTPYSTILGLVVLMLFFRKRRT